MGDGAGKDLLVRGVPKETVEFPDEYRSRGYWRRTRASVIRKILAGWVRDQQVEDKKREGEGGSTQGYS